MNANFASSLGLNTSHRLAFCRTRGSLRAATWIITSQCRPSNKQMMNHRTFFFFCCYLTKAVCGPAVCQQSRHVVVTDTRPETDSLCCFFFKAFWVSDDPFLFLLCWFFNISTVCFSTFPLSRSSFSSSAPVLPISAVELSNVTCETQLLHSSKQTVSWLVSRSGWRHFQRDGREFWTSFQVSQCCYLSAEGVWTRLFQSSLCSRVSWCEASAWFPESSRSKLSSA